MKKNYIISLAFLILFGIPAYSMEQENTRKIPLSEFWQSSVYSPDDLQTHFKIACRSLIDQQTIDNCINEGFDEKIGTLLFNEISKQYLRTQDQIALETLLLNSGLVNNYPLLKQQLIAIDFRRFNDKHFYPLWAYGLHNSINKYIFDFNKKQAISAIYYGLSILNSDGVANQTNQAVQKYGKRIVFDKEKAQLELIDNKKEFTLNDTTYTINIFYQEQNSGEHLVFSFDDNPASPINVNLCAFISSRDNTTPTKNIEDLIKLIISCNTMQSASSILQNAHVPTILLDWKDKLNTLQIPEAEQLKEFYNKFLTKKLNVQIPDYITNPRIIPLAQQTSIQQPDAPQNNQVIISLNNVPTVPQEAQPTQPNNNPSGNAQQNIPNTPLDPNNNSHPAQNLHNDGSSGSTEPSLTQILLSKKVIIPGVIIIGGSTLCFAAYKFIKKYWQSKKRRLAQNNAKKNIQTASA